MAVGKTCKYVCNAGEWTLVSGNAPPGFFCQQTVGACDNPGEEAMFAPVPVPPPENVTDELKNAGEYQFDSASDSLYFSRGNAEKGFRLLSTIAMNELREQFPAVAAEVDSLKNVKSLAGFSVIVPAVRMA